MTTGVLCLGILIHVPPDLGRRVRELRASLGDPVAIAPHVTLLPPTSLDPLLLPAVRDHLAQVAEQHPPFTVRLRGTASFEPVTQVAYLRVDEGGDECDRLQRRVRSGPLGVPLRFPYHPHVTLAQDVPPEDLTRARRAMEAVDESFEVDRFDLFSGCAPTALTPVGGFTLSGRR